MLNGKMLIMERLFYFYGAREAAMAASIRSSVVSSPAIVA